MVGVLLFSVVLVFLVGGTGNQLNVCVALLAASIGLLQVCGTRPRLWAATCLALLLMRLGIPNQLPLWKESLVIAAVVGLWANIHVSVTLAPVIVLIVLGVMAAIVGGREAWSRCLVLTVVAGLAVLVNPYYYQLFLVGFDFSPWPQRVVSSSIVEMRRIFGLVPPYPIWIYPLGLLTTWAFCQGTLQVAK